MCVFFEKMESFVDLLESILWIIRVWFLPSSSSNPNGLLDICIFVTGYWLSRQRYLEKLLSFASLPVEKEQMNVSHALGMKKHRHLFVCLMAVQCGSENHVIIFWLFQKWRDTFCSSLIIFVDKCNKYIYSWTTLYCWNHNLLHYSP